MSHQSNRPNQWVRIVTMEHTWPNKALDISFLSDGSLIPSNNLGWGWQKASSYNYIIKYTFCNHLMQFQAADLHKKDTGIDSFNEDDKSYTTFCPSTSCFNNNHTVLLIKLWLCIRILGFLILTTFLQKKIYMFSYILLHIMYYKQWWRTCRATLPFALYNPPWLYQSLLVSQ